MPYYFAPSVFAQPQFSVPVAERFQFRAWNGQSMQAVSDWALPGFPLCYQADKLRTGWSANLNLSLVSSTRGWFTTASGTAQDWFVFLGCESIGPWKDNAIFGALHNVSGVGALVSPPQPAPPVAKTVWAGPYTPRSGPNEGRQLWSRSNDPHGLYTRASTPPGPISVPWWTVQKGFYPPSSVGWWRTTSQQGYWDLVCWAQPSAKSWTCPNVPSSQVASIYPPVGPGGF